jgi:hypothetical protein
MAHSYKKEIVGSNPFFCGEDTKRSNATVFHHINDIQGTTRNNTIDSNYSDKSTPHESDNPPQSWLDNAPPIDYDYQPTSNDFDYEYLNHNEIKPIFDNATKIHKRYLGDSIALALKDNKNIIVNSGMGTGKTTAIKEILKNLAPDECACIQAPRTKLLRAMATELGFYFYEDLKKEKDKDTRKMMARRLCVPLNQHPPSLQNFPR